jgi:small subunit ribosomal protein S3Ae
MAKVKKKLSKIKTKKKTWFRVIAPALFSNAQIGESYLSAPEKAIGRLMKVNMRDLTNNVKDQNAYIQLKITEVKNSILQTSVVGYQLTSAYVKRAIKKGTARMDFHCIVKTKDNVEVILKPLMVARNRIQKSVKTELRAKLNQYLTEEAGKNTFSGFMGLIINFRLQNGAKKRLSKVYPLKEVAYRVVKVKDVSKVGGVKAKEEVSDAKVSEEVKA